MIVNKLIKIIRRLQMKNNLFVLLLTGCLFILSSCKSFLEVDPPKTQIEGDLIFNDDISASSAMAGVYRELYDGAASFAGGTNLGLVSLAGLSSDELYNYPATDPLAFQFEQNSLTADNTNILSLWTSMYKSIYQANAMLEGLGRSSTITESLSRQLRGESLFARAFCHFYLVNCFGDVPLVLTTDYKANAIVSRAPIETVYSQIQTDLLEAENLLVEQYPTAERVRVNKFTVTAMLARLFLFKKDWQRAEDKATNVINKSSLYSLPVDLNLVFKYNSMEAIWQLKPGDQASSTNEANHFGLQFNVLKSGVVDSFEPGDKRRAAWILQAPSTAAPVYLPAKYKRLGSSPGVLTDEYSMVFRLAEQYLIRAEARAHQPGKLTGPNSSESDINIIRTRAGLPNTTAVNETDLLLAIEQERRHELLAEWGHRWFDLKRTDRASVVLALKPRWTYSDQLYPLPELEMRNNPNLKPQNTGY